MCDETGWTSFNGGQNYRILDSGQIEVDGLGIPRTRGEPRSMELCEVAYCLELDEAIERFKIPRPWLMGLFGVEAGRLKIAMRKGEAKVTTLYFNPYAKRWEDSTRAAPDGEFSGGPLQSLESTASAMNAKYKLIENGRPLNIADLMIPRICILVSAAYFYDQLNRYDNDPILAQAAFNAGSVRARNTRQYPWGFLTHNPHRALYYAQWVNDAVEVLK